MKYGSAATFRQALEDRLKLAAEVGLDADLDAGHAAVAALLDPILQDRVSSGTWDPAAGQWNP